MQQEGPASPAWPDVQYCFGKHDGACLCNDSCKVMDGHRCAYYEKSVLGPPDYKYKLPGYGKLSAQYAEQTKAEKQQVNVRCCECGTLLRHR
jgi:hypothetical protein